MAMAQMFRQAAITLMLKTHAVRTLLAIATIRLVPVDLADGLTSPKLSALLASPLGRHERNMSNKKNTGVVAGP